MVTISTPIVARSLVNEAFDRVFNAIIRGELQPGERIREALLARELGISRGVLREAMQRLEARKMVVRTPNIGVQVVSLSKEGLHDLLLVREALEGMAARLAAENMTDGEIETLKQTVESHGLRDAVKDGKEYLQAEEEDIHNLVAQGSRNVRLIQMLADEIYHQLRRYRFRSSMRPGRTREAFDEHRSIVEAIARRDSDAAETAMRRHLSNARANLDWVRNQAPPTGEQNRDAD